MVKQLFFCLTKFLFILTFGLPHLIFACECQLPEVCLAFARAEKVFVGRALTVEQFSVNERAFIKVTFEVQELYKGTSTGREEIVLRLTECLDVTFTQGVEYFVYVNKDDARSFCSRTTYLKGAKLDLAYVTQLSRDHPVFTIHGSLGGAESVAVSDIQNVKVFIKTPHGRVRAALDDKHEFHWVAAEPGKYLVEIEVPFRSGAMVRDDRAFLSVNSVVKNGSTILRYPLQFKANECDYRDISLYRLEP